MHACKFGADRCQIEKNCFGQCQGKDRAVRADDLSCLLAGLLHSYSSAVTFLAARIAGLEKNE